MTRKEWGRWMNKVRKKQQRERKKCKEIIAKDLEKDDGKGKKVKWWVKEII